ncbi:MAG: hypothetical protein ACK559_08830, partial [bacterium]
CIQASRLLGSLSCFASAVNLSSPLSCVPQSVRQQQPQTFSPPLRNVTEQHTRELPPYDPLPPAFLDRRPVGSLRQPLTHPARADL